MLRLALFAALLVLPQVTRAEVPRVVTDIGPVHSLAAMVMGGLGEPEQLLRAGASPHHMALRPSQARILAQADLVVWIGPDLTPQLGQQIGTLAETAQALALGAAPETLLLPSRDTGLFPHDHDHVAQDDAEEGHDDHEDGEDHHDDHDTHAAAHDPHLWLSPENAALWLTLIAEALADADPENADTYRANATEGQTAIAAAEADARAALASLDGLTLAVAHDAFQYYEAHFGLTVLGAISDAEANTPGAARLAALRDALAEDRPACLLIESGTDPRLLRTVEATGIPTATLDPLGSDLDAGAALYPSLIRTVAARIATCAKAP